MGLTISKELKEKVLKQAREKARECALDARKLLTNEYMNMIRKFYSEPVFDGGTSNIPNYYDRYFNNNYSDKSILISGLGHTFKPIYRNSHNKRFFGGIHISPTFMTNENYRGTYEQVMYSFLYGWHGLPSEQYGGIKSQYLIYNHMISYKNELKKELIEKMKLKLE